MKRTIIFIIAAFCAIAAFSQAKKPTLMVVPSDAWCISNGYVTVYDNQGTETKIPDYKAAFQSDMDLALAISKINRKQPYREQDFRCAVGGKSNRRVAPHGEGRHHT